MGNLRQGDELYLIPYKKGEVQSLEEPDPGLLFDLFDQLDRAVGAAAADAGSRLVCHQDNELVMGDFCMALYGRAVRSPGSGKGVQYGAGLGGFFYGKGPVPLIDPDARRWVEMIGIHPAKLVNRGRNQFGDIQHVDAVFLFFVLNPVGQHCVTKRAGGGDHPGARRQGFGAPFEVDAGRALFFFLEHLAAAGATAKAFTAAAPHFHQFGVKGRQNVARGVVDIVGPAEVATVVIGYPFTFERAVLF
jgi:hypothetical protein